MSEKCGQNGYCQMLEAHVEDLANHRGKGISYLNVMNIKTGDERFVGVGYRKRAADRWVLFNYCPFCGAFISGEQNEDGKAE